MVQTKSLDDVQAAVRAELIAMQPVLVATMRRAVIEAVQEAVTDHASGLLRAPRPASQARSPEAWAALRRGEAAALAAHVETLPFDLLNDDTFAFYAEPVVSRLRATMNRLGDAERSEGNTLMILDQLLETLLNDERGRVYRGEQARGTAVALLKKLAAAERVTPVDAQDSYRALKQAGLNPSAPLTLDAEEPPETSPQDRNRAARDTTA